ncbi:S-adenosyl-L-methionine-dependent methyltransferase [Phaeosphaeriaceae sp. SRC1lsM3a]|nr:S-adenosyl-L-methionine-dependent methyltransferase [Stagonospora sp. SRC1lsM3a]
MGSTMGAREYWYDWYDVRGRLLTDLYTSKGSTLLVDIGCGKGHDLAAFDAVFGAIGESSGADLILQDLPQVLDSIEDGELSSRIKKMPHNLFHDQPVKGARGYFLHHVLHDWSDKYCHQILKAIRSAISPGYSKLLIHQLILPDFGANEMQARYDLVLMTHNSGMERSRTQWSKLLEDAGFINVKFFGHFDHNGFIEAEVC